MALRKSKHVGVIVMLTLIILAVATSVWMLLANNRETQQEKSYPGAELVEDIANNQNLGTIV